MGGGGSGSDGGSGCHRDAGVHSEPLNFTEGEESGTRVRSEATGAFRQVLSFIASFFPEVLPTESQPPHLASWFQGFGEDRRKEPRVYLSCFHKIKELMMDIDSKVTSNAKDQRRSRRRATFITCMTLLPLM